MDNKNRLQVAFAATNQYVQKAIPENKSVEIRGKDFFAWGNDNKYPEFLYMLFNESATLQSIINGIVDYVMGNEIKGFKPNPNEEIEDVMSKLISDYLIYGVAYVNVIKSMGGGIAECSSSVMIGANHMEGSRPLYYLNMLKVVLTVQV